MNAQQTLPTPLPTLPHTQAVPPPPPPPAAQAAGKKLAVSTVLQAAAAVLTIVALALTTDGQESWYSQTVAWAVFATIAAIVQLAPAVAKSTGWTTEKAWTIGAIGAGGLFVWWVLIALPAVSSNQGFTATMAVAAAVIGSWLSPGRRL